MPDKPKQYSSLHRKEYGVVVMKMFMDDILMIAEYEVDMEYQLDSIFELFSWMRKESCKQCNLSV